MSKELFHVQCKLRRVNGTVQTSWIPEEFAQIGRFLKLWNGEKFENGWEVVEKYGRKHSSVVIEWERDFLKQREVSDI